MVLEFKIPASKNFDKLQKGLFKARKLGVYRGKSYIDCYIFNQ